MFDSDFELESALLGSAPGELDTKYTNLPVNENGHIGVIQQPKPRTARMREDGKSAWALVAMSVVVDDPELLAQVGAIGCRAELSMFIDIDPTTKKILTGPNQNIDLGKLYAACNLDPKKDPLPKLEGKSIKFWHEIQTDEKGVERPKVTRFAKARG